MPAWRITGTRLEAVLTATGAHLACLRRRGERLNPLWQPPWPAADPRLVPADGPWGAWPKAPANAVIVGSTLCLDRFGMPQPGDGRPQHGEAGVVEWTPRPAGPGTFILRTELPLAGLAVERGLTLRGDTLRLVTRIRALDGRARRVACCEHTVLGGRFLAGAGFAVAPPGMAAELAMPGRRDPPRGDVHSCAVGRGWWRAANPRLGRVLEACWRAADLPWLCLWTEHRSVQRAPWLGRVSARGLEMSATPWPGVPLTAGGLAIPARGWRSLAVAFRWSDQAGGPARSSICAAARRRSASRPSRDAAIGR